MSEFATELSDLIRDRGITSDEQLARRAMSFQKPGARRINVHARTINNWRNGRSRPRSLEDPRLVLVLKALAPSEEEMSALAQSFGSAATETGQVEQGRFLPRPIHRGHQKLYLAAVILIALSSLAIFSAYSLGPARSDYLAEIPPDQLRLSKDGFVLPHSNEQIIRQSELDTLSGWELYVARNEIFARHGRPFVEPSSGCLQKHFDRWTTSAGNQTGWYVKRSGTPLATDLEYKNAASIRDYECEVRGGQYTCNGKLNPCR
ncbi:YARHG domain-containing protein [Nitratireductor kimnyeongensis]|uniref:YARHG domain-containing protein n=1 Tax=Nitratireductor kimnyeongensis TaxID=430679 RepID=A0ABW0T5E9_9HYPH|nr:YARHG domain-containing protein [Nitratireductor kimnyeongensis]QZZ34786.1 YARHG domain-containing protein [Nitratireductor kimnyeongensis]